MENRSDRFYCKSNLPLSAPQGHTSAPSHHKRAATSVIFLQTDFNLHSKRNLQHAPVRLQSQTRFRAPAKTSREMRDVLYCRECERIARKSSFFKVLRGMWWSLSHCLGVRADEWDNMGRDSLRLKNQRQRVEPFWERELDSIKNQHLLFALQLSVSFYMQYIIPHTPRGKIYFF